mmetsp:Transcript_28794/g.44228  ORF Transcript_28794/g.44228 Transcript_28794/m.44228 type:complete len:570 (+) Transcript_28794:144-1853(+)|eukprot:CAMPEP_0118697092 /NCGR_PEP_ID=MMETSP0800-20121206/14270_1 /TAXON_ID=210618 ORGANISM="Striatella unipunctata, Strain CCMP2910" /NCGR_SAMPLE_ID=MMETSP0800 /ASSEMBLY_ACC=CAM_ASM_000638 /LENGTH=569 /DNA_ID=CAMNT_0006596397 /DNA_START=71 /DNA_END=1780 /DNA_ORIENTATION=+
MSTKNIVTDSDQIEGQSNNETDMEYGNSNRKPRTGFHVLFLSSDTGGGHRASAESLAHQFQRLYPGTTYDLVDVVTKDGVPPYNNAVAFYKHLSKNPAQWKIVYTVSNTRAFEMIADVHTRLMCERSMRKTIKSYEPDVVVSVHPLMTNVPSLACAKISQETGKHLPMFTVVTDLGSAHAMWFANTVEKVFVGSEQLKELAKTRGKVPDEKLVLVGLPIRYDFSVQAEKLGNRMSVEGKAYQCEIRKALGISSPDRKMILAMGGGEGVGSLSNIVDALYIELVERGVDAAVMVVCGRNEELKEKLAERNWDQVLLEHRQQLKSRDGAFGGIVNCGRNTEGPGCIEGSVVTSHIRRILSSGALIQDEDFATTGEADLHIENAARERKTSIDDNDMRGSLESQSIQETTVDKEESAFSDTILQNETPVNIDVISLGFVTQMAEYMVAADVLVTKAGPGTISEAAALSLPVMLTSFLPGQEEGNVDFVVQGNFGAFCSDQDPGGVAEGVVSWLQDEKKLTELSEAAKANGSPSAAADIVRVIGDSTLKWREINTVQKVVASGEDCAGRQGSD